MSEPTNVVEISSRFQPRFKSAASAPPSATAAFVWGKWLEPGDFVGFAYEKCCRCAGFGAYKGTMTVSLAPLMREKARVVCHCALRGAFQDAYSEYENIKSQTASGMISRGTWTGPLTWSRPKEEFLADFELVSKRILTGQPLMQRIFKLSVVDGRDWRECCRILGVDRGNFYHEVYLMQARLGFAFITNRPYSLAPAADYFRKHTTCERNAVRIDEARGIVAAAKEARRQQRADASKTWYKNHKDELKQRRMA